MFKIYFGTVIASRNFSFRPIGMVIRNKVVNPMLFVDDLVIIMQDREHKKYMMTKLNKTYLVGSLNVNFVEEI